MDKQATTKHNSVQGHTGEVSAAYIIAPFRLNILHQEHLVATMYLDSTTSGRNTAHQDSIYTRGYSARDPN